MTWQQTPENTDGTRPNILKKYHVYKPIHQKPSLLLKWGMVLGFSTKASNLCQSTTTNFLLWQMIDFLQGKIWWLFHSNFEDSAEQLQLLPGGARILDVLLTAALHKAIADNIC